MATTTPNYGWDVPTSTDYVKDGATAIETLGDDIDATLYSVTGGKTVGYQLLTSGTLTAASEVIMDNVTSAYRNYRFLFNGATSTQQGLFAINLRNSTGNLLGANYSYLEINHATNATSLVVNGTFGASNGVIIGKGGNSGCSLVLDIETDATNPVWQARANGIFDGAAQNSNYVSGGYNGAISGGITGIRISGISCTLTGTYQLYGAKA
jgi:hypothetical protein